MVEWSGINALLYYGPTIIRSIGLRGDTVTLLASGGIGIVQFLAVIPAILYIDRLGAIVASISRASRHGTNHLTITGRKPLLRSGSALMAFSHLTITLLVRHPWS
ncbi:hypothetical protein H0H81_011968 [Sphagnurus paluster]|uniref:Uncharacterized protein n=1 Tax=Sphagnurus paluster TaxID=117069 RepID=A0A9P7K3S9_9AGAR|nr:hypothetical protein H0H81_011968 [Sphagnurus paluster]